MDEQGLNRKLAEWVFIREDCGLPGPCEGGHFVAPDGKVFYGVYGIPDFTQSLDACFKWLVPKALVVLANIHQARTQKTQEILFRFWLEERWKIDEPDMDALALCLAIEKLIDGEK